MGSRESIMRHISIQLGSIFSSDTNQKVVISAKGSVMACLEKHLGGEDMQKSKYMD